MDHLSQQYILLYDTSAGVGGFARLREPTIRQAVRHKAFSDPPE